MGHLFSRAFRRITQCSQTRNSSTQQHKQTAEHQHTTEQDTNQQRDRAVVDHETIPVGQSIDSSEYQALNDTRSSSSDGNNNNFTQQRQSRTDSDAINNNNQENTAPTCIANTNNCMNENNKQDVEGAVIKIQALVRGHLTRKALKDAHQQSSTPAQNALGQCQFDEDSLTRNPPSAVFLPSSPLNLNNNDGDLRLSSRTTLSNSDQQHQASRTPLESIAEVTETPPPQSQDTGDSNNNDTTVNKHSSRISPSASKLEMPTPGAEFRSNGSGNGLESPSLLSPALSEATTSIDLDYEVPASASILISDHNVKPADRIASVLYFKESQTSSKQEGDAKPSSNSSQLHSGATELPSVDVTLGGDYNEEANDSLSQQQQSQNILATDSMDSEEAAAIRIQSAFRGYRTRKNSPYRTRSPGNSIDTAAKRNALHQQDNNTSVLNELTSVELERFEDEAGKAANTVGRRASRQRHRDLSAGSQELPDIAADQQQQRVNCPIKSSDRDETSRLDEQQASTIHQERVIQGAPSVEEFTTTEDTTTVKEASIVPAQHQSDEAGLGAQIACQIIDQSAAAPPESVESDEHNSGSNKADRPSLSFDMNVGLLSEEANTLDETALSAALEAGHETNNTDELAENGALLGDSSFAAPRPSEASVELDTDSSVLGAALSLNEDTSLANNDSQVAPVVASVPNQVIGGASQLQTTMDDDKSQGVSLMTDELEFESEARRLFDELQLEQDQDQEQDQEQEQYNTIELMQHKEAANDGECALAGEEMEDGSATNSGLESGCGDVTDEHANLGQELLLNEEEQRAIELESDDIERRDPRGQASEERAKSPQIRAPEQDAPPFRSPQTINDDVIPEVAGGEEAIQDKEREIVEVIVSSEGTGACLSVRPANDGANSGRSSPALNSSAPNSSGSGESGDNSDNEDGSPTNRQRHQAHENRQSNAQRQQQQQQTGKNKKKNRKRKGKK